jgi:hypothetical protein
MDWLADWSCPCAALFIIKIIMPVYIKQENTLANNKSVISLTEITAKASMIDGLPAVQLGDP